VEFTSTQVQPEITSKEHEDVMLNSDNYGTQQQKHPQEQDHQEQQDDESENQSLPKDLYNRGNVARVSQAHRLRVRSGRRPGGSDKT